MNPLYDVLDYGMRLTCTVVPQQMPDVYVYFRFGEESSNSYASKVKLTLDPITAIGTYYYTLTGYITSIVTEKLVLGITDFTTQFCANATSKTFTISQITDSSNNVLQTNLYSYVRNIELQYTGTGITVDKVLIPFNSSNLNIYEISFTPSFSQINNWLI